MASLEKELSLIVLSNAKDLGEKVDKRIVDFYGNIRKSYIVPIKQPRFGDGQAKVQIMESVRDKDVYLLADIGNYDVWYNTFRGPRNLGPDEHFQDIKRTIGAISGHANSISVITPLLYGARQDKRTGRESLDCALGLQELQSLGVRNLITFDVHNIGVANAVPTMAFESFFPSSTILETLYNNEGDKDFFENRVAVAPDQGAVSRAKYFAEMMGCDFGHFYKMRDYLNIVEGHNPILKHEYMGESLNGKNVVIVDDMIDSGDSILDVAKRAKANGAKRVFMCVSYTLFSKGIDRIEEEYKNGTFDYIYSTNLSYVPQTIKEKEWFVSVDCSSLVAKVICSLHDGESLEPIHHQKEETYRKLLTLRQEREIDTTK